MQVQIQVEFRVSLFPTLQYSSTPILQKPLPSLLAKPSKLDLAQRTRVSILTFKLMLAFDNSFLLEMHPTISGEQEQPSWAQS